MMCVYTLQLVMEKFKNTYTYAASMYMLYVLDMFLVDCMDCNVGAL
jgi:hypothetical protein